MSHNVCQSVNLSICWSVGQLVCRSIGLSVSRSGHVYSGVQIAGHIYSEYTVLFISAHTHFTYLKGGRNSNHIAANPKKDMNKDNRES
jgi:hypothetical protein